MKINSLLCSGHHCHCHHSLSSTDFCPIVLMSVILEYFSKFLNHDLRDFFSFFEIISIGLSSILIDHSRFQIRIITTKIFTSWIRVLRDNFDANLYRAHIEELNSGLLVHLDDGNREVQLAVYDVIIAVGGISPSITTSEIMKVRNKHRSPKYCDDILAAIKVLDE